MTREGGINIVTPPCPACNRSANTTHRHHLAGAGMFSIAADSPNEPALIGEITDGTFNGGPGTAPWSSRSAAPR